MHHLRRPSAPISLKISPQTVASWPGLALLLVKAMDTALLPTTRQVGTPHLLAKALRRTLQAAEQHHLSGMCLNGWCFENV